jgi:hypothetical protein
MTSAKRNIFLFGAGAVIDWQGPKTDYVTECFVKSGFKARDNKTITSHIYETLISTGRTANFETILSVIEEFIIFFAGKKTKSAFLSLFFEENKLVSSFLNYSINGNVDSHYSLIIPDDEASSSKTTNSKPPEQFFFELLLINLHTSIGALVSKYSFHSKNKQDIIEGSSNKELNDYFAKWIERIKGSDGIVRLYTLNYDRLIKVILENRGIDVFEGFDSEAIIPYNTQIVPNIKRIIEDTNCTCSFNLHGCCEWKLQLLNNYKNYLPVLKVGQQLAFNYPDYPIFETEQGKPGILTNIIAGYQKTQRSTLTPFKQMQYSFDRDCLASDKIIIVGYSFNDEHINESIRMALIYNQNVKIHIVDCGFMNGLELKYFSEFANLIQNQRPNRISEKVYSYGNTFAYLHTFKDFLKNEIDFIE